MSQTNHDKLLRERFVAVLVDSLLANLVQLVGFVPLVAVATTIDIDHHPQGAALALVSLLFSLGLALGSIVAFVVRDRWRSPGKRLAGIEVVDLETGAPCTFKQAAIRGGVYIGLGVIDLVVPLIRDDGRRLGDVAAGTIVVRRGASSGSTSPYNKRGPDEREQAQGESARGGGP